MILDNTQKVLEILNNSGESNNRFPCVSDLGNGLHVSFEFLLYIVLLLCVDVGSIPIQENLHPKAWEERGGYTVDNTLLAMV